ncbi:MAG: aromatic ring-hydroxylating dioxygenase subunit alpha [Hellea sp.]|nr:aromatic ring-hydroxylating dioxygenase subunit alpha [Hellea sp.]
MDLQSVLKPIEDARGLPNDCYISQDHFKIERDKVFFPNWAGVGFISDVAEPGDVCPVEFLGMPLLLVCNKASELRVFQNTCRHRGMILVDEPCHLRGPIRCPYHSWSYDYDGNLVRTPSVGGIGVDDHKNICPDELGLFEVRAHVWQGVVFVNISGDAPAFEIAHEHLVKRWAEFDQPYHLGGEASQFDMLLKTNWKLAVENYCESYHLPWIHPELNEISPIDAHYPIEHASYAGQGSENYRQLTNEKGKQFKDFENLSDIWNSQSEYISYFPNVLFGVHRDHAFAMLLMPQGPEKTLERVALFYATEDIDSPQNQDMLKENARIWQGVFAEDIGVVEGMQKGRHGIQFDGGKFSPVMDGPTHKFHHWVARQLTA